METLIVLLFSLAIVLLIISFFGKDKVAKLEEDLEQMTLTYMQDIYQLKKKVKILEEEFVIQDDPVPSVKDQITVTSNDIEPIHEILKSQVLSLYSQGLTLDQIARQSSLTKEQTISVIEQQRLRGE
jgi:peptidoglycan hydrolase CwlO-like protein